MPTNLPPDNFEVEKRCREAESVAEKASLLAKKIHRDFFENLKTARVWGSSAFDGQMVQRDYVLQEGEIVELRT